MEISENLILRAGAGAGKTTALVDSYVKNSLSYFKKNGVWPRVVLTTFTRKATQELQTRIRQKVLDEGTSKFLHFVDDPEFLLVTTLHGLCFRFLRSYGPGVGLSPKPEFCEYKDLADGLSKLLLDLCSKDPLLRDSYSFLRKYKSHSETVDLVFQGIEHLREHPYGQEISDFEGLKFLEGEIQKWKQESEKFLSSSLSFQEELTESEKSFFAQLQVQVQSTDRDLLSSPGFSPTLRKRKNFPKALESRKLSWENETQKWKQDHWNLEFHGLYLKFHKALKSLARALGPALEHWKRQKNWILMEDLELYTLECLRKFPVFGEEMAHSWDYWMIDEYQDTSPRQVEILKSFCEEKPCFIVGDPQQSIYLFRGAQTGVFQSKEKELAQESRRSLSHNYRSHSRLVQVFNGLFSSLENFQSMLAAREESFFLPQINHPDSAGKAPEHLKAPEHVKAHELGTSLLREPLGLAQWVHIQEELAEQTKTSSKEQHAKIDPTERECQWVVRYLKTLIDYGAKNIAILARKHSELRTLAKVSKGQRLQIQFPLDTDTYRSELLMILSLLRFLIEPHDDRNLVRYLTHSHRPLLNEVETLTSRKRSLWVEIQGLVFKDPKTLYDREFLQNCLLATAEKGPLEAWTLVISTLREWQYGPKDLQKILGALLGLFSERNHIGFSELNRFLLETIETVEKGLPLELLADFVAENASKNPDSEESEPVQIHALTVHASKGLQFDHVILLGVGNHSEKKGVPASLLDPERRELFFPLSFMEGSPKRFHPLLEPTLERQKKAEQEERLRLFYVAVTRARKSLVLVSSQKEENSWLSLFESQIHQNLTSLLVPYSELPRESQGEPQGESLTKFQRDMLVDGSDSALGKSKTLVTSSQVDSAENRTGDALSPQFRELGFQFTEVSGEKVTALTSRMKALSESEIESEIESGTESETESETGSETGSEFESESEESLFHISPQRLFKSRVRGQKIHRDLQNSGGLTSALLHSLHQQGETGLCEALLEAERLWQHEESFTYMDETGRPWRGQIDAWGTCNQGELYVVDFKTGRKPRKPAAWLQLSHYRQALLHLYPHLKGLPYHLVLLQTEPMKAHKIQNQNFLSQFLFADGAAKGNPGPAGWGYVLVSKDQQVVEKSGHFPVATNNQMELVAVIEGLKRASAADPVQIYTDSTYVIRGITQWIFGWMRKNWMNQEGEPVANREYWEELYREVRRWTSGQISWHYVRGHVGVPGNERVDELAQAAALKKFLPWYEGSLLGYKVAIFDLPEDTSLPEMKEKTAKTPALSYLSSVSGKLMVHPDWRSCEARVKGVPGAKFKKAQTAEDEVRIVEEWGFNKSDLEKAKSS